MKIGPLISETLANEQDRKDLLHWQQKLIAVFPDSYDVGLETRAPYGDGQGPFNVVTVARNGKELFYFDTRRSSIDFYSSMGVCGEHVRSFSISVKDLQKSVNILMLMYELQRKIRNLFSDAKCIIDKHRKKQNTLVIEIASEAKGHNSDLVSVEYKTETATYYVMTKTNFTWKTRDVGSTKDMTKALDLVEKAFKSISE